MTFQNNSWIWDTNNKSILAIDVNAQGIIEHTVAGKRLKTIYPSVYDKYIKSCLLGEVKGGDVLCYAEKDTFIALLVTMECFTPYMKDTNVMIENYIDKALVELTEVAMNMTIEMPIPMQYDSEMSQYMIQQIRKNKDLNITFQRK